MSESGGFLSNCDVGDGADAVHVIPSEVEESLDLIPKAAARPRAVITATPQRLYAGLPARAPSV